MATLKERIADLEAEIEALREARVEAVEANCASIAVEWCEVGGVRVGLDTTGAAVRVELNEFWGYGWSWEGLA